MHLTCVSILPGTAIMHLPYPMCFSAFQIRGSTAFSADVKQFLAEAIRTLNAELKVRVHSSTPLPARGRTSWVNLGVEGH
jgi:hypothetical protein